MKKYKISIFAILLFLIITIVANRSLKKSSQIEIEKIHVESLEVEKDSVINVLETTLAILDSLVAENEMLSEELTEFKKSYTILLKNKGITIEELQRLQERITVLRGKAEKTAEAERLKTLLQEETTKNEKLTTKLAVKSDSIVALLMQNNTLMDWIGRMGGIQVTNVRVLAGSTKLKEKSEFKGGSISRIVIKMDLVTNEPKHSKEVKVIVTPFDLQGEMRQANIITLISNVDLKEKVTPVELTLYDTATYKHRKGNYQISILIESALKETRVIKIN
jgi:hypothetical protein